MLVSHLSKKKRAQKLKARANEIIFRNGKNVSKFLTAKIFMPVPLALNGEIFLEDVTL